MDKKNYYYYKKSRYGTGAGRQKKKKRSLALTIILIVLILAVIGVGTWLVITYVINTPPAVPSATVSQAPTPTPTPEPTPTPTPTPSGASKLPAELTAAATDESDPSKLDFKNKLQINYESADSYQRETPITFGTGEQYTSLEGVITFRGNNYRDAPSWGTADIKEGTLEKVWEKKIGAIDKWVGAGWTGQPLVVKWPEATKKIMNLKEDKKSNADLVEVILAPLDGKIYFLDLADGTATRDTISTGVPQKGTSSLHPAGLPLLYCGQGIGTVAGKAVSVDYRVISLIDQKLAAKTMTGKDPFALRKDWTAYDASALIDAETNTLIEPGENGVLYTIRLDTTYDEAAGTMDVKIGERAKYNYTTPKFGSNKWYGMENSPVTFRNYVYFTDNGGYLQCVDLNTLKLIWAIEVTDDSDSTMCLEESTEDGTAYLYTACQTDDKTNKATGEGPAAIRKVDALNGKVIWKKEYTCYTATDNAGGALASPMLGKKDISNLIIYTLDKCGTKSGATMVALDRKTGDEVWKLDLEKRAWSSPVDVYTPDGKSYIVQCNNGGDVLLIEGTTGTIKGRLNLGETTIEASPVVYNDMIVIATRSTQKIFGIKIK